MKLVDHWTEWPMVFSCVCIVAMIVVAGLKFWEIASLEVLYGAIFLAAMVAVLVGFVGTWWRFR